MKDNIEGFPGYHITKDGKMYTSKVRGSYKRKGSWTLKKTFINEKGYEQASLCNSKGVNKCIQVHRLVALAYIPNPNNLPVVMHLDDIGIHNHVNNLKWGTHKDNTQDSISKGRNSEPPHGSGLNSPRSLLKDSLKLQRRILRLHNRGLNYKTIGIKLNLNPKVISRFIRFRNSLE